MKFKLLSSIITLVLAITLGLQWRYMNQYEMETASESLKIKDVANQYCLQDAANRPYADLECIVTGIYIQSLQFFNSSEVYFTGYIWQHFPKETYAGVPDEDIIPGFILPEQINTGSDISPVLTYRESSEIGEVIGWYVEATLKQHFDYSKYPFDHKTVWVRLWSRSFTKSQLLVPDVKAYFPQKTNMSDYESDNPTYIFGIDENIVLGSWKRTNTYFDYKTSNYDTTFGLVDSSRNEAISNKQNEPTFPELYYNFVIKRRFNNSFVVHLLPLFLVSVLLYAALLTVSDSPEKNERLGFNTTGFLGMGSALFFVILIAHIQLREQFAGARVVYLEYYYILMYIMLVVCTINTYLFAIRPKPLERFIIYKDNLIPKILYWPVILIALNILTAFFS